jgi:glutamine---fructose-6-phosphate transaminase (isomerizing)
MMGGLETGRPEPTAASADMRNTRPPRGPDGLIDLERLETWREASTAGEAISAAIGAARAVPDGVRSTLRNAERIVLTGAGSSYYLAQSAAAVGREAAGLPVVAAPLSDVLLRPAGVFSRTAGSEAVVVISRSGSTSEALSVATQSRAAGRPTFGVTCRAASPLAGLVDSALVSPAGDESAIVMTRSFGSMLALLLRLIADLGAPAGLGEDIDRSPLHWGEAVDAAATGRRLGERDWLRVVVLGGGPAFGIASEWGLKLTETCQVPAYAYQPLEFRHGPMSLCEPGVLVVGLLGGPAARDEARVLDECRALGAETWALVNEPSLAPVVGGAVSGVGGAVSGVGGAVSVVGAGLDPAATLPLLLYPGHALALTLALTRGLDPDRPRHLSQVVVIEPG